MFLGCGLRATSFIRESRARYSHAPTTGLLSVRPWEFSGRRVRYGTKSAVCQAQNIHGCETDHVLTRLLGRACRYRYVIVVIATSSLPKNQTFERCRAAYPKAVSSLTYRSFSHATLPCALNLTAWSRDLHRLHDQRVNERQPEATSSTMRIHSTMYTTLP